MLALALLFGGKNALVIGLSARNHVKNDAGQFVGGSGDPSRPSQAGAQLAIKDAPIGSTPFQGLGRRARWTRLALLRVLAERTFPPLFLLWGQKQAQEAKAWMLRNLDQSVPTSASKV